MYRVNLTHHIAHGLSVVVALCSDFGMYHPCVAAEPLCIIGGTKPCEADHLRRVVLLVYPYVIVQSFRHLDFIGVPAALQSTPQSNKICIIINADFLLALNMLNYITPPTNGSIYVLIPFSVIKELRMGQMYLATRALLPTYFKSVPPPFPYSAPCSADNGLYT